ncbi:hypothetical protein AAG906_030635 [Vitis piasezkii]
MVLLAMAPKIKMSAFFVDSKITFLLQNHHHPAVPRSWKRLAIAPVLWLCSGRGLWQLSGMTQQGFAFSSAFCVSSSASEALGFLLATFGSCCPPAPFAGYRSCFGVEPRVRMGMLVMLVIVFVVGILPCRFRFGPLLKMPAKKTLLRLARAERQGCVRVVYAEKSVDKLNVRQFYEHFCIPNGVSVQLVDGEAVSTEKSADNAIYFTKEQFNAGLGSLSFLVQRIFHFTRSSGFHPSQHSPVS